MFPEKFGIWPLQDETPQGRLRKETERSCLASIHSPSTLNITSHRCRRENRLEERSLNLEPSVVWGVASGFAGKSPGQEL